MKIIIPLLLLLFACSSPDKVPDTGSNLSYYKDIKPLVATKCQGCHAEGEGAFGLSDYSKLVKGRLAIEHAITTRRMPVWPARSGHQTYRGDLSLSDAEVATFKEWFAVGAPEGDPATAPASVPAMRLLDLVPDLSISQSSSDEGFLPNQKVADDYRCFVLPWTGGDAKPFITGFQAIPKNKDLVHHLVTYIVKADLKAPLQQMAAREGGAYQCFSGVVPDNLIKDEGLRQEIEKETQVPDILNRIQDDSYWLAHWAPGMKGQDFPEGTGIHIAPGSFLVLQAHYHPGSNKGLRDPGSELRFRLAESVEKMGFIAPISRNDWLLSSTNHSLEIAPGGELTVSYEPTFKSILEEAEKATGIKKIKSIEVHGANLHMHSFGSSAITGIIWPDGKEETLLEIPRWDLRWQRDYFFTEPKTIAYADVEKTRYKVQCSYKNPGTNPVFGGFSSEDEMCFNFSYLALVAE